MIFQTEVGIVSMSREGGISDAVRECFLELGCTMYVFPWFAEDLYEIILSSPISHWFFTGNTPDYVTDIYAPHIDKRIYGIRTKLFFFVCYSHQLLCMQRGSPIHFAENRISGLFPLIRMKKDPIWNGVAMRETFMAWYKQYVHCTQPPIGWTVIARLGPHIALMRRGHHYSCQVHPERRKETYVILKNWLNMLPPVIEPTSLADWLRGWSFFDPVDGI